MKLFKKLFSYLQNIPYFRPLEYGRRGYDRFPVSDLFVIKDGIQGQVVDINWKGMAFQFPEPIKEEEFLIELKDTFFHLRAESVPCILTRRGKDDFAVQFVEPDSPDLQKIINQRNHYTLYSSSHFHFH